MGPRDYVIAAKAAAILHPSGRTVTYQRLEESANRMAHHLHRRGLRAGDTVAILMENNAHIHAVMWAAHRSGLYYTLVNSHLTAAEAAYIIDDCGAKAVVSSRALRAICEQLAEHLPDGLPDIALLADDEMQGWQRTRSAVQQSRSRL